MSHDDGQGSEIPPPDNRSRSAFKALATELRRPPIGVSELMTAQQTLGALTQLQKSIFNPHEAVLKSFQPSVIKSVTVCPDVSRIVRVPVPDLGAALSRSLVNSVGLGPGLSAVLRAQMPDLRAITGTPAAAAFAAALRPACRWRACLRLRSGSHPLLRSTSPN